MSYHRRNGMRRRTTTKKSGGKKETMRKMPSIFFQVDEKILVAIYYSHRQAYLGFQYYGSCNFNKSSKAANHPPHTQLLWHQNALTHVFIYFAQRQLPYRNHICNASRNNLFFFAKWCGERDRWRASSSRSNGMQEMIMYTWLSGECMYVFYFFFCFCHSLLSSFFFAIGENEKNARNNKRCSI